MAKGQKKGPATTKFRLISDELTRLVKRGGREILEIEPKALTLLAEQAFSDASFFLRTHHLEQITQILEDPEASANDKFVAKALLENAAISAEGVLPLCQDTGTAIVYGWKGQNVWTGANDAEKLAHGVFKTYTKKNLRYSQNLPLSVFDEINTETNLPAQIDIQCVPGNEFNFLFVIKGAGSANKCSFFQMNKALLASNETLENFLREKLKAIGVSACPPYRLAVTIGGTSAEMVIKTNKLATTDYLDDLVTEPTGFCQAYRDLEWEDRVLAIGRETGLGAQFTGKYFALQARVIRMPRHGGSLPIAIGVSCSAHRNIKGKITKKGIFLEELDKNPARFLKKAAEIQEQKGIPVNLDQPIERVIEELSKYPVGTLLKLNGTIIVARDIAHLKLKKIFEEKNALPDYVRDHPIYYAGPAKTPKGMPTGSFGPTTAERMDAYVPDFLKAGYSRITLAKGNRNQSVIDACKKYNGFYLGTIGGAAALVARENILSSEVVAFEDLGMEAIRKIKVRDFPAFIVFDNKGNSLYGL